MGEWERLYCIHGVQEHLDYHDCPQCDALSKRHGKEPGRIWLRKPAINSPKSAVIRVCASCEWVYDTRKQTTTDCPLCGFASYGARSVYGKRCYKYLYTQIPWRDKKLNHYDFLLWSEIQERCPPEKRVIDSFFALKGDIVK